MTGDRKQRRWYDKDPLLSMAMKTLEKSSDEQQIRLAMHLVKVINEHNIEVAEARSKSDDKYVDDATLAKNARWYDIDRTLKSSVEMLRCCPPEAQRLIAREMAQMLNEFMDEDEDNES